MFFLMNPCDVKTKQNAENTVRNKDKDQDHWLKLAPKECDDELDKIIRIDLNVFAVSKRLQEFNSLVLVKNPIKLNGFDIENLLLWSVLCFLFLAVNFSLLLFLLFLSQSIKDINEFKLVFFSIFFCLMHKLVFLCWLSGWFNSFWCLCFLFRLGFFLLFFLFNLVAKLFFFASWRSSFFCFFRFRSLFQLVWRLLLWLSSHSSLLINFMAILSSKFSVNQAVRMSNDSLLFSSFQI